jgi:hypothetical protein
VQAPLPPKLFPLYMSYLKTRHLHLSLPSCTSSSISSNDLASFYVTSFLHTVPTSISVSLFSIFFSLSYSKPSLRYSFHSLIIHIHITLFCYFINLSFNILSMHSPSSCKKLQNTSLTLSLAMFTTRYLPNVRGALSLN